MKEVSFQTLEFSAIYDSVTECAVCCEYFGRDRELVPAKDETGTVIWACNSTVLDDNPCGFVCTAGLSREQLRPLFDETKALVQSKGVPKFLEANT